MVIYLTVHEDAKFQGGTFYVNKGYLKCLGDCSFSNSGCQLKMENVNDYIFVAGDFVWNNANSRYVSSGTIELQGDFTDNSNSYYFVSENNNKVIFSGNKKQNIILTSSHTYFESLEITNTSSDGIAANLPISAGVIIRNGHNISYPVAGRFGWTLDDDQTVSGDLYLIGDELNLNGHTLTVTGNFIQGSGKVNINNGTLNIEEDYRIQSYTIENDEKVYNYSTGYLIMNNSDDRVNITGDFVMGSANNHSGKLTNGIMTFSGDFTQLNTNSEQNFSASGSHKVVFSGSNKQTVSFASGRYDKSHFADVEFDNSSEDGIEITGTAVAVGEISNSQSNITGYIDVDTTASIKNNSIKGNIRFSRSYTLSSNLSVNGTVRINSQLDLNGKTLEASENVDVYNSVVKINGGKLVCKGDLSLYSTGWSSCYLEMTQEEDSVIVYKDFLSHNYNTNIMTAGTLEIKGDFKQEYGSSSYMNETNFRASGTHKTIFSGNEKQTISFASPKSYFNIVEIRNYSNEGVYCSNGLNAAEIITNGCKVTYSGNETLGWTLDSDEVISDDLILIGDTLDLNGHTLEINGDLIHKSGTVYIHGGKLVVNGSYYMQSTATDSEGKIVPDSFGSGILKMNQSDDYVKVSEDFVAASIKSHSGMLTNGVMEISGNVTQNYSGNNDNFITSDNFVLKLVGTSKQIMQFSSPNYSKISNIIFNNTSYNGVQINGYIYITKQIDDESHNVNGSIYVNSLSAFEDGFFSGDVYLRADAELTSDIKINGALHIESDLDINGFTLNADSISIGSGSLDVNGGAVNCSNEFTITSNGKLIMNDESDYITVGGDFSASSNYSHSTYLTNGVLEIKGDFTQSGNAQSFLCTDNHKVLLSGKSSSSGRIYRQTIYFTNPGLSKFNHLVVTLPISYYSINAQVSEICNDYVEEIRDIEAPAKVEGLTATGRTASTVSLSWNTSQDNIGVTGYDVYRNNEKIATVNKAEFINNKLEPESTYNYKVCAFDEVRNLSEFSDMIAVTTLVDTIEPTVPQSLKVKSRTGSSLTLTWLPSSDNVRCTGYEIYRDGEKIAEVQSETYKDTDLTANTEYAYKVRALDQAGNQSEFSSEVTGYAVNPHITSITPGDYEVLGGDSVAVTVRFLNTGNSVGNKVRFEYSSNEENWNDVTKYFAGQKKYSDSELYASVNWDISELTSGDYTLRCTLYDADDVSDTKLVTYTIDHSVPDKIENLTAVSENGIVKLNWGISAENDFVSYDIYRSENENTGFSKIKSISNKNTVYYEDTKVSDSTAYYYYIIVTDQYKRESVKSDTVSVTVTEDAQKPVVQNFTGTTRINANAVIRVSATDNKSVAKIQLQYYNDSDSEWVEIGKADTYENAAAITWNTTELSDGEYSVRAFAWDAAGNKSEAKTKTFVIDNTGPSKPTITSTASTDSVISIKWTDSTESDFAYYQVEQKKGSEFVSVGKEGKILGINITELDPDTTYTFRVVGYDDLGNRGSASDEFTVATSSDHIKPYITNILPTPSSFKSDIDFEITAQDNYYIKSVKLYYSYDQENWTHYQTLINNDLSKECTFEYKCSLADFDEGTVYFKITAADLADNQSEGTIIPYRIDRTPPQRISDLTVADKIGYAELNWSTENDDVEYFVIYRADNQTDVYTQIANKCTTKNYYDNNVDYGKVYSYKIRAVDAAGNIGELSNEAVVQISEDMDSPVIYGFNPTNQSSVGKNPKISVVVFDARLDTVYFEYKKADSNDIWIEFGKKEGINGSYEKIESEWNTTGLEDGSYLFRAVAKDYNGNTSVSNEISYTLDATAPAQPVLELLQNNYQLDLEWNQVTDAVFYKVYRKSALEGNYKLISKLTDNQYADKNVIPGLMYSYKIEAYDSCGNYSESNVMSGYAFDVDTISPTAAAPEEITAIQDYEIILDGTESTDNVKIKKFEWDMGNGETVFGSRTVYVYDKVGTYTATLTVTDTSGNTDSVDFKITVLDKSSCGRKTVRVIDSNGNPLSYSYVYLYSEDENNKTLKTDSDGLVTVSGGFGEQRIAAYKQGYLPKEQIIYIDSVADDETDTIVLEDGEIIFGDFSVHRMELEELITAGIDFDDPMNYDTFDLEYSSLSEVSGQCGYGWSNCYESYLKAENGRVYLYITPENAATFVDEALLKRDFEGTLTEKGLQLAETKEDVGEKRFLSISSGMDDYELLRNENGSYTLTTPAGQLYDFNSDGKLIRITQNNGKYVDISYGLNSMKILEPSSGMYMTANYNDSGLLTYVEDYKGRKTTFAYENGNLVKATNALGESVAYIYDKNHRIVEEKIMMVTALSRIHTIRTAESLNRMTATAQHRLQPINMMLMMKVQPLQRLLIVTAMLPFMNLIRLAISQALRIETEMYRSTLMIKEETIHPF